MPIKRAFSVACAPLYPRNWADDESAPIPNPGPLPWHCMATMLNVQNAAQAAEVLRPLAGPFTFFIFTIGVVSAGLFAIPVMAGSSAYAVGDALGWSRSLGKPVWQEWRFYGVIGGSCVLGLLVNLLHVPPFEMLYYAGVLNAVISPPLLFIVTQSRAIQGSWAGI